MSLARWCFLNSEFSHIDIVSTEQYTQFQRQYKITGHEIVASRFRAENMAAWRVTISQFEIGHSLVHRQYMKGHVVPTLVHPCLHSSLQVDFSRPGAQQSGGVTISQFGIGHSLVHRQYTKVSQCQYTHSCFLCDEQTFPSHRCSAAARTFGTFMY